MLRTIKIVSVVIAVSTFLNTGVIAGIEPSPFQSQINQLNACENILISIENVITQTRDNPPIDGEPSPNLTGVLNKLETTDIRVQSVSGFITSIYEEVMGTEPSPFRPDIVPALEDVELAAGNIVGAIGRYIPPMGVPSDFIDVLGYIQDSAHQIVTNAQLYINNLTGTPPPIDCAGIHDEAACNNETGGACEWVPNDTDGGECRDIPLANKL